jgi:hypothetical protein
MTEGSRRPNGGRAGRPAYLSRPDFSRLIVEALRRGFAVSWDDEFLNIGEEQVLHTECETYPDYVASHLLIALTQEVATEGRRPLPGRPTSGLSAPWHEFDSGGTHITYKSG